MAEIIQLAKDTLKGGTKTEIYPKTVAAAVGTTDEIGNTTNLEDILIKGIRSGANMLPRNPDGTVTLPSSVSGAYSKEPLHIALKVATTIALIEGENKLESSETDALYEYFSDGETLNEDNSNVFIDIQYGAGNRRYDFGKCSWITIGKSSAYDQRFIIAGGLGSSISGKELLFYTIYSKSTDVSAINVLNNLFYIHHLDDSSLDTWEQTVKDTLYIEIKRIDLDNILEIVNSPIFYIDVKNNLSTIDSITFKYVKSLLSKNRPVAIRYTNYSLVYTSKEADSNYPSNAITSSNPKGHMISDSRYNTYLYRIEEGSEVKIAVSSTVYNPTTTGLIATWHSEIPDSNATNYITVLINGGVSDPTSGNNSRGRIDTGDYKGVAPENTKYLVLTIPAGEESKFTVQVNTPSVNSNEGPTSTLIVPLTDIFYDEYNQVDNILFSTIIFENSTPVLWKFIFDNTDTITKTRTPLT